MSEFEDREEVVHVVQSQSGSVVVTCAEDEPASEAAAAKSRAANSLSSVLGPRATRISVTAFEDDGPPGGIEKLCMIVDRFETDARRISRGSMPEKTEDGAAPSSSRHHVIIITRERRRTSPRGRRGCRRGRSSRDSGPTTISCCSVRD